MEYKGFNNYKVEVMRGDELLGTFSTVTNLYWLTIWLNIHPRYRRWDLIKVYHRLSDTFIGAYSREGDIPPKPRP